MMGRLGPRSTIDKAIIVAGGGEKKANDGSSAKQGQRQRQQGRPYGIDVVLGSQWGDEGKGKLVDILSQVSPVLPRRFSPFWSSVPRFFRFSASGSFSGGQPSETHPSLFFPFLYLLARPPAARSTDPYMLISLPWVGSLSSSVI
jgi:hypothetical protein